ncbi:MAG: DUF4252 domain-containing protein [Candidatus Latescibacterota bacterium]|nr:MAG: DUF4252 domain-containing protein [Candidatus Latescibacterota bacterium]
MRSGKIATIIGFAVLLTLVSGCLWAPELDRVRRDIERQIPGAEFKKEIALSLGPVTMGLARLIVKLAPDTEEAASYLRDVSRVKVAVYEAENVPYDVDLRIPRDLEKLLEKDDWELVVKTRDKGEAVWILCRVEGDRLKSLYVVALDNDELVLVQAHGNLDRLFEKAMRDHTDIGLPAEARVD